MNIQPRFKIQYPMKNQNKFNTYLNQHNFFFVLKANIISFNVNLTSQILSL